jgi:hypothetical protein
MLKKNQKSRVSSVNEILGLLGFKPETEHKTYKKILPTGNRNLKLAIIGSTVILIAAVLILLFSTLKVFGPDPGNPGSNDRNNTDQPGNSPGNISDPDQNTAEKTLPPVQNVNTDFGKLFIECSPWGDVYIDNVKYDTTPLKDYIRLKPGRHTIKVVHPDYPPYVRNIRIAGTEIETMVIDFKYSVGYLICNINPWGDVYINGELKGTTPLREPILLYPGNYTLTVANPQYGRKEVKIDVKARDTLSYNFNFEVQDSLKNY